ncbi:MAG: hypothetical protein JSV49_06540 [Thermoplasmata archaeon]|nr:MAG: hypothetical protein JSV49_06540 [Thermoplasmata archaeon]
MLIYYMFPEYVFGYPTLLFLFIFFVVLPIIIEIIRLKKNIRIFGLREHEQHHVASYVWFTCGAVLLIALFPQQIAAPCILGAAIGDVVLGVTRDLRRRYTFSFTFLILLLIFLIFMYNMILAIVAAGIILVSESVEFRIKSQLKPQLFYSRSKKRVSKYRKFFEIIFKTDDDFMMQVIPAISLAVIYFIFGWHYMPPELIHESPTIALMFS